MPKPLLIHPEIESSSKQEKQPWLRQKSEPARYFLLFRTYCQMGRGRSLQAVWEQEHSAQKSTKATEEKNAPSDDTSEKIQKVPSVSGAWKKAAAQWKWKERAEAWDLYQRDERHKNLLAFLDHEAQYITAAQRLNTLDTLMVGCMGCLHDRQLALMDFKTWLKWMNTTLKVNREIRMEMRDFEKVR